MQARRKRRREASNPRSSPPDDNEEEEDPGMHPSPAATASKAGVRYALSDGDERRRCRRRAADSPIHRLPGEAGTQSRSIVTAFTRAFAAQIAKRVHVSRCRDSDSDNYGEMQFDI